MSEGSMRSFDPVLSGQSLFNQLLQARARPGLLVRADEVHMDLDPPRLRLACALLLTLLDLDVGLHVAGPHADAVARHLRLHTRVRFSPLESADFVLLTGRDSGGQVLNVAPRAGRERVTLVYAPEALSQGATPGVATLSVGTGRERRSATVHGMASRELDDLRTLAERPTGVDVWLAGGNGVLAAIPPTAAWTYEISDAQHGPPLACCSFDAS